MLASRIVRRGPAVCLMALFAAIGFVPQAAFAADAPRRPNILLFLIDDMGWMDLACQGNKRIDTPNIDRFASQGMRFTDAYSAAPVCSPTRAAILTGKSPARLHITTHLPGGFVPKNSKWGPADVLQHLPLAHVTIAERLKASGYRTAFLGKWHVASKGDRDRGLDKEDFYPKAQGFDLNIGGCHYGGPPTYFDPYRIPTLASRKEGEYLPDRLADEAIDFMSADREKPFLLFLWHYTVHWPMEAKEEMLKKYASRKGPGINDIRYAAMIECLDQAVGRVLAALDRLNLAGDTLVVFTSDNGGYSAVADNRPLRAGKGYLYEGGIRVPLIVRWPGVVAPGTLCHEPVISTDLFPTFLAASGLTPDPTTPADGESLVPLLRQSGALTRKSLYFHFPNFSWHKKNRLGGAIRQGDYKLIERYDDGSVELYNLAEDLSEEHNLSAEMPDRARRMQRDLVQWRKESGALMPKPLAP